MDQTKIGKLIASLRKEKGMTQRELGDKVGVGFKAVSKWERGITCPDISIINELSKILGITSDELLTGELNKEHTTINKTNKKFNKKILLIVFILIFTAIAILIIYKMNKNHSDIYELTSINDEYFVEGKVVLKQNEIAIYISKIKFLDKELNKITVKNYMYKIDYGNTNIVSYGYMLDINELPNMYSIGDIMKDININYENFIQIDKKELKDKGITLKMIFLDKNDNLIEKNIILELDN